MQRLLTICLGIVFCVSVQAVSKKPLLAPQPESHLAFAGAHAGSAATVAQLAAATGTLYLFSASLADAPEPVPPQGTPGNIFEDKDKIRIVNLGPIINHEELDYAPAISADGKTLYYVSNRPGTTLTNDEELSHDFYAAKKDDSYSIVFDPPYNIDTSQIYGELSVNTWRNEGAASISADQQTIYFTACNRPDGVGDCDIYFAEVEGDKWGKPQNLGRNVNSERFDTQPSIAPDKSRIYFASNRDGAVGGDGDIDIWYSDYDFEFEEWKEAKRLGTNVNTEERDWTPFIGADNQTLFFSSGGHSPNFGGQDFFYSVRDENDNWSPPSNIGRPINTEQNEGFISLPASGDIIYFASQRGDIKDFQGNYDIFMAFVPSFFRTQILTGQVLDECSGESIPANISIYNPITKETKFDTLDMSARKSFEHTITNLDYGNPLDSIPHVDLEVTAENSGYGKVTEVVRVSRPAKVKDKEKSREPILLDPMTLRLGQRPVLGKEIAIADFIKTSDNPDVKDFRGLVMEEIITISLYPLLPYVFFDAGSGDIPERYILFNSSAQTNGFSDERIPGGTMEKYYNVLNIYGYRLTKYADTKVKIVGCNDDKTPEEKRAGLSKERAEKVYNYLRDIWNISEDRMELVIRKLPKVVSNRRDSLGIVENRRVEIQCDKWEVVRPIIDKDPTLFPSPENMIFTLKNGIDNNLVASRRVEVTRGGKPWKTLSDIGVTDPAYTWDWQNDDAEYPVDEIPYEAKLIVTSNSGKECESDPIAVRVMQVSTEDRLIQEQETEGGEVTKTLEVYNLILFPFDRSDAGKLNERILSEYVFPRLFFSSEIDVVGHTDVVGLFDHNLRLSKRRSGTVEKAVNRFTRGKFASLTSQGVGEEDALYTNDLPEGRFYNRTVQITIQTPVKDTQGPNN